MKKILVWLSVLALVLIAGVAGATELVIGSGSAAGVYNPIVSDMARYCNSNTLSITHYMVDNKFQGGSINNLKNLLGNKVMASIIQADIAHLAALNNPDMGRIIALLPLHNEQVHVIVPYNVMVQQSKKGFSFFGKNSESLERENPLKTMDHLTGKRIAAWGGSVKTAEIIKLMANIPYEIVVVTDEKDKTADLRALELLEDGQVDAIIFVVGTPASYVEQLPKGKYKLLGLDSGTQDRLKEIYSVAKINYDNMGRTGQTVSALSVGSVLFTRTYRQQKMVDALAELQQCVRKKIYDIQDTPGTHPVWQSIDPSARIKWPREFKK